MSEAPGPTLRRSLAGGVGELTSKEFPTESRSRYCLQLARSISFPVGLVNSVLFTNVTDTLLCPVLPLLSVTRQRQRELKFPLTVMERDHSVALELGLFTEVSVSPETYCQAYV